MHTPPVLSPFPISAHTLRVGPSKDALADVVRTVEPAWTRAQQRWGARRVAAILAVDDGKCVSPPSAPWVPGRGPTTMVFGDTAARQAVTWAHTMLHRCRVDAVWVGACSPIASGALVLERQADAWCELLGVEVWTSESDGPLVEMGAPDWIVIDAGDDATGLARGWPAALQAGAYRGAAGLVLHLAGMAATLEGREGFDGAGASIIDPALAWACTGITTSEPWVAPIRLRG